MILDICSPVDRTKAILRFSLNHLKRSNRSGVKVLLYLWNRQPLRTNRPECPVVWFELALKGCGLESLFSICLGRVSAQTYTRRPLHLLQNNRRNKCDFACTSLLEPCNLACLTCLTHCLLSKLSQFQSLWCEDIHHFQLQDFLALCPYG